MAALEKGETLTAEDRAALLAWYRTFDPEWQALNKHVQEHLAQEPKPPLQKAMICSEGVSAIRTIRRAATIWSRRIFAAR